MIDIEQVGVADERRTAAMVAGDLATLDELIAEDCRYVHSTGVNDTKAGYLASNRVGIACLHLDPDRRARFSSRPVTRCWCSTKCGAELVLTEFPVPTAAAPSPSGDRAITVPVWRISRRPVCRTPPTWDSRRHDCAGAAVGGVHYPIFHSLLRAGDAQALASSMPTMQS